MSILLEVILYLVLTLGIIGITILITENWDRKSVIKRESEKNKNVEVDIKFIGFSDEEINYYTKAIYNGNYDKIIDIIDDFKVFKKDV